MQRSERSPFSGRQHIQRSDPAAGFRKDRGQEVLEWQFGLGGAALSAPSASRKAHLAGSEIKFLLTVTCSKLRCLERYFYEANHYMGYGGGGAGSGGRRRSPG